MTSREGEHSAPLALFDRVAILAALSVLFLAAWTGQRPIALVAGLLVAFAGLANLWSRYALRGVVYERILGDSRAFPGEHIELTVRLTNGKALPVTWLRVDDAIPELLRPDTENWQAIGDGRGGFLTHFASLLWYRRAAWRYRLLCRRRGCYALGPARIGGGDPLGLYSRQRTAAGCTELIVYPRLIPIEQLELIARQPLGEMRARQRIFEDPSRLAGVREYQPADPLKRIHWHATARRQQLHSRVYEPTTTLHTVLALSLDGFGQGDQPDARFEHAVSVTASLAAVAHGQHQSVGLLINGGLPGSAACACLHPAAGRDALIGILEVLARVAASPRKAFAEFLGDEAGRLPWGTTIAVVADEVSERLLYLVVQLRRQGRPVTIFRLDSVAGKQ